MCNDFSYTVSFDLVLCRYCRAGLTDFHILKLQYYTKYRINHIDFLLFLIIYAHGWIYKKIIFLSIDWINYFRRIFDDSVNSVYFRSVYHFENEMVYWYNKLKTVHGLITINGWACIRIAPGKKRITLVDVFLFFLRRVRVACMIFFVFKTCRK